MKKLLLMVTVLMLTLSFAHADADDSVVMDLTNAQSGLCEDTGVKFPGMNLDNKNESKTDGNSESGADTDV